MENSGNELNYNVCKCRRELSRSIYKMILSSINYEYLKPGIKIDILKISRNIGVKTSPVTDALNLLSDYGFLEKNIDKNEFYTISKYSQDIIQTYYARSILESNAAFLCARQFNCPNKERLNELAEEFEKFDDVNKMKEADFEFHSLIVSSCGNDYIMQFYNTLTDKIIYYMMSNIERLYKTGKDINFSPNHIKIVNAIVLNEPTLAEKEMKDHIDEAFVDAIFYSIFTNQYKKTMNLRDNFAANKI